MASIATPKIAVFDFDNTCIFHDIGDATLRYQLARLQLRLTPEQLAQHLPLEAAGITHVRDTSTDTLIALKGVAQDIQSAYASLWPAIDAGTHDSVVDSTAHDDFRTRVLWLSNALYETAGIGPTMSYPWMAGWLAGHTAQEIRILAQRAWRWVAAEPIGRGTFRTASPGETGMLHTAYCTGISAVPEMRQLIVAMQAARVEVYIVSASQENIIEGAVEALHYPIARDHIFGMRLAEDAHGRYLSEPSTRDGYPVTYGQGKVDVIHRYCAGEPLFVAGDADTDVAMLRMPGPTLRLLINRDLPGEIRALYELATPQNTQWLLQGRDDNTLRMVPQREFVAFRGT
ncbi:MAG: HAD family hydrolase [Myxococcota bacterium]